MTRTSEWVSPGHSDKVADFIAAWILDRYLKHDPKVHMGLEVMVKDNFVTLGGEVTSAYHMPFDELNDCVRCALYYIGYTRRYADKWGEGNCINPDRLEVVAHIGEQSPDIAHGVDNDGWGDQGIFWGMATSDEEHDFMPLDHWYARRLGMAIYDAAHVGYIPAGLDIKTQVTVSDGNVANIVVAAPVMNKAQYEEVEYFIRDCANRTAPSGEYQSITFNGTGTYVRHSSWGDCGVTGRKLAVDFYGGNCFVGGGNFWGKDPTKADVTLNAFARRVAVREKKANPLIDTVYCALDCCIGQTGVHQVLFDGHLNKLDECMLELPVSCAVKSCGLDKPVFADRCRYGIAYYGYKKPEVIASGCVTNVDSTRCIA